MLASFSQLYHGHHVSRLLLFSAYKSHGLNRFCSNYCKNALYYDEAYSCSNRRITNGPV